MGANRILLVTSPKWGLSWDFGQQLSSNYIPLIAMLMLALLRGDDSRRCRGPGMERVEHPAEFNALLQPLVEPLEFVSAKVRRQRSVYPSLRQSAVQELARQTALRTSLPCERTAAEACGYFAGSAARAMQPCAVFR